MLLLRFSQYTPNPENVSFPRVEYSEIAGIRLPDWRFKSFQFLDPLRKILVSKFFQVLPDTEKIYFISFEKLFQILLSAGCYADMVRQFR